MGDGMTENLATHNRALEVNLDPHVFGTFADTVAARNLRRYTHEPMRFVLGASTRFEGRWTARGSHRPP